MLSPLSSKDRLIFGFCLAAVAADLLLLRHLIGWGAASVVAALIVVGGVFFWFSDASAADTAGEIGKLLMFGLAAALPATLISHSIENRQHSLERTFAARQRAEDLQLQIGFQGNLAGANLRGRDLSRFQLPGRNLDGADLEGATLTHANLRGAHLVGAKLDRAKLGDVDLTLADLTGASFAGADLHDASLFSANLRGACFARGRDADGDLQPADLTRAHLAGAYLHETNFAGATLKDALFTEDLRDARGIDTAVFVGANTDGAAFAHPVDTGHPPFRPQVASPPPPRDAEEDSVASVSDGDTVRLTKLGKAELLGVSAPTAGDRSGLGRQAQRFARRELRGATVRYQTIPARDKQGHPVRDTDGHLVPAGDKFGRKFVYLWRVPPSDSRSGGLFNQEIIALGYAKANPSFIAKPPHDDFARGIIASQEPARRAAHRVWNVCFAP